jgi:hypothetical protein
MSCFQAGCERRQRRGGQARGLFARSVMGAAGTHGAAGLANAMLLTVLAALLGAVALLALVRETRSRDIPAPAAPPTAS